MIGRTVGHYRIVAQLGRGGSGTVYKAVDETLNRDVAIKVLNPDLADTVAMKRFHAEATILARLNHPEIATIYELFQSDADLLMVMEFVRGETLDRWSDRLGPLAPDRAAHLVERILSALEHAHLAGVVHRDMKPANVIVTEPGGVKVLDFGIARVRGAERITIHGGMVGTPDYMAPEQVLNEEVDARADLYAVGVILYRLLTTALPFEAETTIGTLQRLMSGAPTPLSVHRKGLPDWCDTILQRALAKSPADRFQSAGQFREALARSTGNKPPERVATEKLAPVSLTAFPRSVSASANRAMKQGLSFVRLAPLPSIVLALAATIGTLLLLVLRPTETIADRRLAESAPIEAVMNGSGQLVFDAKALVGTGRAQRQRNAKLMLADDTIDVADDGSHRLLYSVPYKSVTSISYSHSFNPMWRSPQGPALVTPADGGVLGTLGVAVERHWISLGTKTSAGFVVLRVADSQVEKVLSALQQRTGITPQRLAGRHSKDGF
jgi:serine/threonine-protein kinase